MPTLDDVPPVPSGDVTHRERLGRTIRDLRRGRGLTSRELAGRLGVSLATVSGIENGRTGVSTRRLAEVAEALGVPVPQLLADPVDLPPRRAGEGLAAPAGDWRAFPPLVLDTALTGALSAFLEYGYHGATMRTIADRAGLSVPGLYHHHDSKQDLLVALLDVTMADLHARTRAALAESDDPVERFAHVVECLALFHTHRRELGFVGASEMRSLEPVSRDRVAALRVAEQRVVDATVEDGVRAGAFGTTRPHEAARAVVTMCTALAQWFRHDGPAPAEHVAAQYVEFALDLVRCAPDRRPAGRTPSARKDP
ncbi:TetR family transcriptional regulator [Nocardioides sp. AX2bis]|uniref:TetR family transcriptional regulator n=1 Tax=Nocardioides sp. AX2bis TaxID=2653157 RepID=UPI0012F20E6C|nr:TetR family transcriptional regulator [Nocardioides sp. AX2bis]VXC56788.1 conserved hypothetical protein [Nocardioides sp. AX2bis]